MQKIEKPPINYWNQAKHFCPSCAKNGTVCELKLYQINFNEAVYLCPNHESCLYPLGYDWKFVNRTLDELYGSDGSDISDNESVKDEIEDLIQDLMKDKKPIDENKDILCLFNNFENVSVESRDSSSTFFELNSQNCLTSANSFNQNLPPDILEISADSIKSNIDDIPNSKRIKIVSQEVVSNQNVSNPIFEVEVSKEIDNLINSNENSTNLTDDIDFNLNLLETTDINVNSINSEDRSLNQPPNSNDSNLTYTINVILPDKDTNTSNFSGIFQNINSLPTNETQTSPNKSKNTSIDERYNRWHLIPNSKVLHTTQMKIIPPDVVDKSSLLNSEIEIFEFNPSTSTGDAKSPTQKNEKTKNSPTKRGRRKNQIKPASPKPDTIKPCIVTRDKRPRGAAQKSQLNETNQNVTFCSKKKRYRSLITPDLIKSPFLKTVAGSSVLKTKVFGAARYRPIEL